MRAEAAPGLCVLGSINVDQVTQVRRIARPGETVLGGGMMRHFGGKGANQAVAAACAGAPVVMIGAVGDDRDGAEARANLVAHGVDAGPVRVLPGAATGRALVMLAQDGENAITVLPGANMAVAAAAPDMEPPDRDCRLLLAQMELPPEVVLEGLSRAVARGLQTVLNLAPVPVDLTAEQARRLLHLTDVLVVNETELRDLAARLGAGDKGATPVPDRVPDQVQTYAQDWGVILVVTLGGAGLCFSLRGQPVVALPAHPVQVVDTTGAGDSFVGTLAAGLLAGAPLEEAARAAARAASHCCTHRGAQPPLEARGRALQAG